MEASNIPMPDILKAGLIKAMNHGHWEKNTGISLLMNLGYAIRQCGYLHLSEEIWKLAFGLAEYSEDTSVGALSMNLATCHLQQALWYIKKAVESKQPMPDDSYPLEVRERVQSENQAKQHEWEKMLETVKNLSCFVD